MISWPVAFMASCPILVVLVALTQLVTGYDLKMAAGIACALMIIVGGPVFALFLFLRRP